MKKYFITFGILVAGVCTAAWLRHPSPIQDMQEQSRASVSQQVSNPQENEVVRVVDGDTFVVMLAGKEEKVRMLGIDTPETVDPRRPVQCFGKEASDHLKLVLAHKVVRLESDPTNSDRDKYDRLLRYVYLDDGTFVNARMISEGYAYAYTKFLFTHRDEFLKLQTQAREAGRGLWAAATCRGRR